MRILIGLILAICGFLMTWKTSAIVSFTGLSPWAQKWLGSEGGTYLMYKLIGILFILFGFMAMTNMHNAFIGATIGKLLMPQI
jgi:hypothetical protein